MKKPRKWTKTAKKPFLRVWRKRGTMGMSKRERVFREAGKVSVNFGGLTFASLVLGTIIKGDYSRFAMLSLGD